MRNLQARKTVLQTFFSSKQIICWGRLRRKQTFSTYSFWQNNFKMVPVWAHYGKDLKHILIFQFWFVFVFVQNIFPLCKIIFHNCECLLINWFNSQFRASYDTLQVQETWGLILAFSWGNRFAAESGHKFSSVSVFCSLTLDAHTFLFPPPLSVDFMPFPTGPRDILPTQRTFSA